MIHPDPPARMPQVGPNDFTQETRAFFDQWTGGIFKGADQNPVLRTFAHHPKLAGLFSALNVHLLSTNTVPVKLRQIAIMRTAWITGTVYMWSSHLNTSINCGLSDDMYAPIQSGPDDAYFTAFERTWMKGGYWAMVVTPPDRIPVTATEEGWMAAVLRVHGLPSL